MSTDTAPTAVTDVPRIPAELLFDPGERSAPAIAPDGTSLAFTAPVDGIANIWVGPLGDGDPRPVTTSTDRDIRAFQWAPSGRELLYRRDAGGDERYRLYGVDIDSGESRDLVPIDGANVDIVATSHRRPDTILVSVDTDDTGRPDLYRLELSDRELELVAENPGFTRWLVDQDLEVRGGVRMTDEGGGEVVVRGSGSDEWRTVLTLAPEDALFVVFPGVPLAFDREGTGVYLLTSQDSDASRYVRLDLATGGLEPVAEMSGFDMLFLTMDPVRGEPRFAYVPTERFAYLILDPTAEPELRSILDRHPDAQVELLGADRDDRRWVYAVSADDDPGSYWLFDRDAGSSTLLFERQPALEGYELARKEPFTFTARDGLEVSGYLTFPPGADRSRLPTVVKPHGGPWHRDPPGWEAWPQLIANRGYLCVQVEYRGSLGYGKKFLDAGDREWGAAMHDDVVDAIAWVVDQGWADAERIGMFGASYGGYETLVTVTREPDLLRCAVAGTAPVDLTTHIGRLFTQFGPLFARRIGDPDTDREMLWERSPLRLAEEIRTPLLLYYSERDARVSFDQAEALTAVLDGTGTPYELVVFEEAGHFIEEMAAPDRDRLVAAIERFLAAHLGSRTAD